MNSRISSNTTISNIRAPECCLVWTSLHFLRQLSWEKLCYYFIRCHSKDRGRTLPPNECGDPFKAVTWAGCILIPELLVLKPPPKLFWNASFWLTWDTVSLFQSHTYYIASRHKFILVIWYSQSVALSESPMVNQITDRFLTKIYLALSAILIKSSSQWHLNDFKNLIHPNTQKFDVGYKLILRRLLNVHKM